MVKIRKHSVELTKTDTCLTYALKRIGLAPTPNYKYENLESDFDMVPFFFGPQCNSGVLLLWDSNKETVDLPWTITESGRIITRAISSRIHVAVYEGDGLVSDCSRDKAHSSLPVLKMRHINELGRQPDKILIYKHMN